MLLLLATGSCSIAPVSHLAWASNARGTGDDDDDDDDDNDDNDDDDNDDDGDDEEEDKICLMLTDDSECKRTGSTTRPLAVEKVVVAIQIPRGASR